MEDIKNYKGADYIRSLARESLRGQWKYPIVVCLVFSAINMIFGSISFVGMGISLILAGPLALGLSKYFLKFIRKEDNNVEILFSGFTSTSNFFKEFLVFIVVYIFIILWSLLLIIPGIIASLRYSMTFYILADNPDIEAMDAINKSKEIMQGHKWELFCLCLSFIGWTFLSIFTFGIGFIWLIPYIETSIAHFYETIK